MTTIIITFILGFVTGALVFRNNAARVEKTKGIVESIIDKFRS
jgi:hypothetical protein